MIGSMNDDQLMEWLCIIYDMINDMTNVMMYDMLYRISDRQLACARIQSKEGELTNIHE